MGDFVSYWTPTTHVVMGVHTRSLVAVEATLMYDVVVLHTVRGVHVRSLVVVHSTDSYCDELHMVADTHTRSLVGVGAAVWYCVRLVQLVMDGHFRSLQRCKNKLINNPTKFLANGTHEVLVGG